MTPLEEAIRDLEIMFTEGVGDGNITYIKELVRKHLVSRHPFILGIAETLGISTAQPQTVMA